ncbi:MAG: hypothetical protein HYS81_02700 [Candidatus Aenigmatarchaeota archaeon]|nr:MAG: hypothetical protein HYS81_02700 [Candidatus Aenigmarchaeota archaeon]
MRNVKGLSPLIATVLLIAFTITVATFIAVFARTFTSEQITESGQAAEEFSSGCQRAILEITAATYDASAGKISVLARNRGTQNLTNFRIVTFTSEVDFLESTPPNSNVAMGSGDLQTFAVTGITTQPSRVQIQSKTCPREAIYTCALSGGGYVC